ncbi:MAG: Dna2/Cas4 domain-containing protein [Anaerolineales bacterium]|nr:Dna2/Cas4 domain-containing protein [Anaerolineales bacterium]
MADPIFLLAAALLFMALLALYRSRQLRERSGVPAGELIYTDDGAWFPQGEPLYDDTLGLVGKPDYIVEQEDGLLIPVEVKSAPAPRAPRESHVLQLAAYCLLVESNFGVRPTHGILQYQDQAFAIDFSEELEEDLLDILAEMQQDKRARDVDRDHEDWRRCSRCGLRQSCNQRLG